MSINGALSNAVSGMSAASRRAEVTAHNIANASTEGYARQRVSSSHHVVHGRGAGVLIGPAERITTPRLTADRRDAGAQSSGDAAQAAAARALADTFEGSSALFSQITALENNLRSVAETPESPALQERAVTTAAGVVSSFAEVSTAIEKQRTQADNDIASAVAEVNAALEEIETLNSEIGAARVGGRSSASFEQERDNQLDIIAKHMPIRLMQRDNGQVAVLTDTGVTLLDAEAQRVEFTPTSVVTADMDFRAGSGSLSGISVNGIDITPGAGTQSVKTGSIAGLFEARDGFLLDAVADIDALATDVVSRFESAGIAGADGRGLFTDYGAALSASPAPGLAGRLRLNERVDPSQGGEAWRIRDGLDAAAPGPAAASDHVRSMLDAMTEVRSAGGSLATPSSAAGLAAALGSVFERRGQSLEDTAAGSQARLETFESAETAVVGVDIDQELQHLILIEQAYAANARVIEVADRLVQRLLEI